MDSASGGSDGPLPRGARAAFVLAKIGETTDDWQEVPARKGKRGWALVMNMLSTNHSYFTNPMTACPMIV